MSIFWNKEIGGYRFSCADYGTEIVVTLLTKDGDLTGDTARSKITGHENAAECETIADMLARQIIRQVSFAPK